MINKMKDIELDESGEIIFENADFKIADSEQQHIMHLLEIHKGGLREVPILGFGINRFLKNTSNSLTKFKRELKIELENDGFSGAEVEVDDQFNLQINV